MAKQIEPGYGESSEEDVNSSGYRYPATHFKIPPWFREQRGEEEPKPRKRSRKKKS